MSVSFIFIVLPSLVIHIVPFTSVLYILLFIELSLSIVFSDGCLLYSELFTEIIEYVGKITFKKFSLELVLEPWCPTFNTSIFSNISFGIYIVCFFFRIIIAIWKFYIYST